MAIQDDFAIDYVDRKITYTTAFVDDRPPNIYTVNELYSWLQDTFDEPAQMDDPVPMSAQTPTQYTIINKWFMDNESMKALYGGSIQTSGWTKSASEGITQLRWTSAVAAPDSGDIGTEVGGDTSTATGIILAVDTTRQVVWVRNNNANQFQDGENVDDTATGTAIDFTLESTNGFQTGESIWANLFSVGSLQTETEIYVGQEDDYMGGAAYHTANPEQRHIEKIDEWWDSDVDFFSNSPNLLGGAGHFDLLVKTFEAGAAIDGSRLAVFARQFSKVYSHFELVGGVGNFVVPFASTGADLNAQDGPYEIDFSGNSGTLVVGDVVENDTGTTPVGRLRAVITGGTTLDSATGTIEYYLIGENEPLTTTNRTLVQLANTENYRTRETVPVTFTGASAASQVTNGPAQAQGVTITFGSNAVDVDEDGTPEQYACTINCNSVPLADVYKHVMFLTSRGNQDGTVADTQDTLLDTAAGADTEPSEFYRAVGDLVFTASAKQGTGVTEGDYVEGQTSGATGVVISTENTATGLTVLHQVKGTFQDSENVSPDGGTNYLTIAAGGRSSIVDNTAAPFGTFAGGRWFVAQGVVLTGVPTGDANNWQTVDLTGATLSPPTVRTITFAGLSANDRAAIFEVDTADGIDITKDQNGVASGGAQGASTFELDSTVALDVPGIASDTGDTRSWVRVVDTSDAANGTEFRYEFISIVDTTVTLQGGANLTGTLVDAGASATVLVSTGKFTLATFGTDGYPKIGMEIRDTTTNAYATILRRIDDDSIETTPLSAGTWAANPNSWAANQIVVALAADDTVYFPYIDDVAAGATIAKSIKYVEVTECVARARFSDPDIGGQRSLPFEQTGVQITDANLTVTAILNDDTIAS